MSKYIYTVEQYNESGKHVNEYRVPSDNPLSAPKVIQQAAAIVAVLAKHGLHAVIEYDPAYSFSYEDWFVRVYAGRDTEIVLGCYIPDWEMTWCADFLTFPEGRVDRSTTNAYRRLTRAAQELADTSGMPQVLLCDHVFDPWKSEHSSSRLGKFIHKVVRLYDGRVWREGELVAMRPWGLK